MNFHMLFVLYISQVFHWKYAACSKKPHFILFLVDDLGWNDVGFHGMRHIPTPNIDILAANGVILNNFYTSPACTPSRAALMSGKYPTESGLQHAAIHDGERNALPIEYKIFPEVLNDYGYVSRIVGKWHLGFYEKKYTPTARGFKSHYGFWTGQSDMFFHTSSTQPNRSSMINVPPYETSEKIYMTGLSFQNNYQRVTNRQGEYFTDIFTERAVQIIRKHHTDQPLFLFLSHHGVHRSTFDLPIRAPEKYTKPFTNIKDNTRRNFAGALTAIDRSVGEVMEALEKNNMLNNTIFLFSSDNGAPMKDTFTYNGGSNYPLRGAKLNSFEGGVKVAAFLWSPLLQKRGFVYNGLMYISDWMPTLVKALGGNPQALGKLDALDVWDTINRNVPSPRKNILLQSDPITNQFGYRSGNYKIVSGSFPGPDSNGHFGDPGREDPPSSLIVINSTTEQVLRRFYGEEVITEVSTVSVDCGIVPTDDDLKCDPMNDVCLFDLETDPCEYRNLAKRHPEVVKKLKEEMSKFTVKRPDLTADYNVNPVFHGGYFSPWVSDTCENVQYPYYTHFDD